MKRSTKWLLLETIVFIASGILALTWYDWKLFVILVVFVWANNLSLQRQRMERHGL